ncbi:MFS transporter [Paenibacillus allorhizosphaerae]|uniref:Fosmidomycin resistance protein n=1 Tax=Paenibacillus allorhizosphaerae TaxID=2849866 RepID=A0ABM8VF48_9BACL|nr:MFS transporter [Paenibacillus allorhizosphaerae]CAG7633824.1 Fosmidomycin resistance protein [Paenibacillus allorhizosphaerae]
MQTKTNTAANHAPLAQNGTMFTILIAVSMVHLLNDTIQAVVPAIFPIVKDSLSLTYTQLGLIAFALNLTASILQPAIGMYSDKKPQPYLLPLGVVATLLGVLGLALATGFWSMLGSVVLVGIGSSVFHPETAKVAYLAAGARRGLAQGIFQVGGNAGQALAPIMTALIFVPLGQAGILWFTILAAIAIAIQMYTARWYSGRLRSGTVKKRSSQAAGVPVAGRRKIAAAISILVLLLTSKMAYLAGMTSFYSFYIIDRFQLSVQEAQWCVFAFLAAGATGTFFGGPLADMWGRRNVIWFSIIGALPFAFLLPYMNFTTSVVFCVIIGFTIMSSGSVNIVYAQELLPGNIGTVSGLFFGLAFGAGGLGAAALGALADTTSIAYVIKLCAFLPLIGLLTIFLPSDRKLRQWAEEAEQNQIAR